MTPAELAALHRACFQTPRPWSAEEFEHIQQSPNARIITNDGNLLVLQLLPPEAEILTLAVDPKCRRKGKAREMVTQALEIAQVAGIDRIFLEVAADNTAALALYQTLGFTQNGARPGYYKLLDGTRVDALLMAKPL